MFSSWKRLAIPVVGLALILIAIAEARGAGRSERSRPATTAETSAATCILAEGRLTTYPGAQVVVGTDARGTVARLLVEEKQAVKKGALLAELRADDLRASLAEARARVAEAEADLRLYEVEVERAERLVAQQVESTQTADRARRNRDAGQARLATARAAVDRLQAELAKTRITAPIDGVVVARQTEAGETIEVGAPVVTLADLARVRVEAEVDEYDAGRVALGAPVVVRAEGYERSWQGRVEEIPDTVSGRRLKPQDPGKPTDTRVLLVKVALAEPTPLKLGQRVEVEIGSR